MNHRAESIETLLRWNANRTIEDMDGFTPLQLAEQCLFDVGVNKLMASNASTPESLENRPQQDLHRAGQQLKKITSATKRKPTPSTDSPPTKQHHGQIPSTMLSPSSERYTPPQLNNYSHQYQQGYGYQQQDQFNNRQPDLYQHQIKLEQPDQMDIHLRNGFLPMSSNHSDSDQSTNALNLNQTWDERLFQPSTTVGPYHF